MGYLGVTIASAVIAAAGAAPVRADSENGLPEAVIDQVFYSKTQTGSYSCATTGKETRPTNDTSCLTLTQNYSIQSLWTLKPHNSLRARSFAGKSGDEDFIKERINIASPRHNNLKCITTETYHIAMMSGSGPETGGKNKESCYYSSGPAGNETAIKAPPDIPRDTIIGTFKGIFKPGYIEDFSITERSRSRLLYNGASNKPHLAVVEAAIEKLTIDRESNTIVSTPVPCSTISVAGRNVDGNCRTSFLVDGPYRSIDVTPRVGEGYYRYALHLVDLTPNNASPLEVLSDRIETLTNEAQSVRQQIETAVNRSENNTPSRP